MRYAHYWFLNTPITKQEMNLIGSGIRKIIDESDIVIAGPDGKSEPEITSENILFNKVESSKSDNDEIESEPFILHNNNEGFLFCNTKMYPYDSIVTASLILIKYYKENNVRISSDGNKENWTDGAELAKKIIPEKDVNNILEEIEYQGNLL